LAESSEPTKRNTINAIVDFFAALVMVGLVATGVVLRLTLPAGTNRTRLLWGLTRHGWGDIHFWMALAMLAIVFVHILVHWNWIVAMAARSATRSTASVSTLRKRIVTGVITIIIVAGLLIGFWRLSVAQVRQTDAGLGEDG